MEKFTSFDKLSKKKQKEFNAKKRSDGFGMAMVTKVVPNKKKSTSKQRRLEGKKSIWDY